MPSFAKAHTDADLAAVSSCVLGLFGGKIGHVTPETVRLRRM
jgi:mono/diheme cytochrome c family protein